MNHEKESSPPAEGEIIETYLRLDDLVSEKGRFPTVKNDDIDMELRARVDVSRQETAFFNYQSISILKLKTSLEQFTGEENPPYTTSPAESWIQVFLSPADVTLPEAKRYRPHNHEDAGEYMAISKLVYLSSLGKAFETNTLLPIEDEALKIERIERAGVQYVDEEQTEGITMPSHPIAEETFNQIQNLIYLLENAPQSWEDINHL